MTRYQLKAARFEADWDRDGTYGHVLSNITGYVLSCSYRVGFDAPFVEVAPPARMQLVLDNSASAWSIAKSGATFGSLFKKGVLVRLTAVYDEQDESPPYAVTGTLEIPTFIGTIQEIQIDVGRFGANTVTVTVEDPTLLLQATEYHPPLLTNVTTNAAIKRLFDDAAIVYPYPQNYWLLGVAGATELGDTTILYNNAITDFEAGETTLAYSGDQADGGHGVSCRSFIADIVAAEAGGKFFWDGQTGKYIFLGRYHVTEYADLIFELDPSYLLLDESPPNYRYADDLRNVVELSYQLRKIGTSAEVLYTSPNVPITLSSGATRRFRARYADADAPDARVGGLNMIAPTPGTDYVANSASDGSGDNMTSSITVSVEFAANSAQVNVINPTNNTIYLTTFQLRGTKLSSHAQETAAELDGTSIFNQGKWTYAASLPVVSSSEFAEDYARSIVSRFANPIGRFERITRDLAIPTTDGGGLLASLPNKTIGDLISYSDPFIDSTPRVYMIVGENSAITPAAIYEAQTPQWDVTWILEPLRATLIGHLACRGALNLI